MASEALATAMHEAGHCIVGLALGRVPISASCVRSKGIPGKRSLGEVRFAVAQATTIGAVCATNMAGWIAELKFYQRSNASVEPELLAHMSRGDVDAMLVLLRGMDVDGTMVLEMGAARAEELLSEHWPRVERMAAELLERGTLNREEIEAAYAVR
jgi:hypothetical protein